GREFREYIVKYTNAATIVADEFRDTEDLEGLFSGFDPATSSYDISSWQYKDAAATAAAAGQRELHAGSSGTGHRHGSHGGILALRGHASIQGSTDIPTLYDILPGYIPMPQPDTATLSEFVDANSSNTGYWGAMDAYTISLLKAYWGDAATGDNDYCFDYLP